MQRILFKWARAVKSIAILLIFLMGFAPVAYAQSDTGLGFPSSTTDLTTQYDKLTDSQKRLLRERFSQDQTPPDEVNSPSPKPENTTDENYTGPPKPILPPPPGKRTKSRLETIMSGKFPTEISRELTQFGYNFFDRNGQTFEQQGNVPVGEDYVIGPGDAFTIHLWGKVEQTIPATVTRDGRVILPRLGSISVNGLTFLELKLLMRNKFKEYYTDFDLSITMGELRSIDVFVVGEAQQPGSYTVHSLSTVLSALFAAGGPSKNGSLRQIKISQNGSSTRMFDLYDFLTKGDKSGDIRLHNGDTIFIPVIGPVVGIAGNVRRPAVYEIRGGETVSDAINLAGGVLPTGHLQNVVVERIQGHQRRVIKSFNLDELAPKSSAGLNLRILDGDIIKIYPVHDSMREVVFLEGHVKYPREYQFKPGLRIGDILASYEDLLPEPYLDRAEIIRLVPPDLHPQIVEFQLEEMLNGDASQNLLLQERDRIRIYAYEEKVDVAKVEIKGAVREPGIYRLMKGMRIRDLIFKAGNMTNFAYLENASIARLVPVGKNTEVVKIDFSPAKALAGLPSDNVILEKDDKIHIREIPQYARALNRNVYLEGEVLFPGEYTFAKGETISALVERAGGLTDQAYALGAVFQRERVKVVQRERLRDYVSRLEEDILTLSAQAAETAIDKTEAEILSETLKSKKLLLEKLKTAQPTGRMVVDLIAAISLPLSDRDLRLEPGDRLIVEKKPDFVNVLGEVYNPTALFAERGKKVGYYIDRVGGPTDDAHKGQIYLVRADGSVISKSQDGFLGMASWDNEKSRWSLGGFDDIIVVPGDTIIVPKRITKYPWLRIIKDITEIVANIAVSAGVILIAADND